jgi:hypothetical protein
VPKRTCGVWRAGGLSLAQAVKVSSENSNNINDEILYNIWKVTLEQESIKAYR